MIFIIQGGTTEQKNNVVNTIAQLANSPVYRRSVMNVPLLLLRKNTHPHSKYISEIFHSYIGDVLAIDRKPLIDTRATPPGDYDNEVSEDKKNIISDITQTVIQIANSLTKGIYPLFLFDTTLKYISEINKRHHVFVDLQYKEELEKLNKRSKDEKIIIKLIGESIDELMPTIKELTLLENNDFQEHVSKQVEIPQDKSMKEIADMLVEAQIFTKSVEIHESKKGLLTIIDEMDQPDAVEEVQAEAENAF